MGIGSGFARPVSTAVATRVVMDGHLRYSASRIETTPDMSVVDRLKDMILTGGYNVSPAEIERVVACLWPVGPPRRRPWSQSAESETP